MIGALLPAYLGREAAQAGALLGLLAGASITGQRGRPARGGWLRGLAVLAAAFMAGAATAWSPIEPALGVVAPVCAACTGGVMAGAGLLAWPPHEV